jgi:hypothetical protein
MPGLFLWNFMPSTTRLCQPGDILHHIGEYLRHIGLDADDYPLYPLGERPGDLQPLLIGRCARLKLVVLAAYHRDLDNTVAPRQQVEVFRVCGKPALSADDEGVLRLCQQFQALVAGPDILLDGLEGVAHASPVDGDIPVAPRRLPVALPLDETAHSLHGLVPLYLPDIPLFLSETVAAPVAAPLVGIEADGKVTQNHLRAAFAPHIRFPPLLSG